MDRESLKKGRMAKRGGDACAFVKLQVVLLQQSSFICHNLPLQIVIYACVEYKYKSMEVY